MFEMYSNMRQINLFWTGGWDSTFRLLQILVKHRELVQTYYIIDPNRKSFRIELEAMEKIKKIIFRKYPFTRPLFLPIEIVHLSEINQDPIIEKAYRKAIEKDHLGSQYDWLARFCKQNQIFDMEMCVQKLETPTHPPRFSPYFERDQETAEFVYKQSLEDEPEYLLFQYFRFPILDLTKEAIFNAAKQNHWLGIMNKTWFCHAPIKDKLPCGKCTPCQQIISDQLLKKRIPFYIRLVRKHSESWISKFLEEKFLSG